MEEEEATSMGWRKKVLFVAMTLCIFDAVIGLGIVFMAMSSVEGIKNNLPMLVTALVGVAAGVNAVLGMICKELLTEPSPPVVPAFIVAQMIKERREEPVINN